MICIICMNITYITRWLCVFNLQFAYPVVCSQQNEPSKLNCLEKTNHVSPIQATVAFFANSVRIRQISDSPSLKLSIPSQQTYCGTCRSLALSNIPSSLKMVNMMLQFLSLSDCTSYKAIAPHSRNKKKK